MLFGPLAAGWAVRAGTPANLLAFDVQGASRTDASTIVLPDEAAFSGSVGSSKVRAWRRPSRRTFERSSENPLSVAIVLDGDEEGGGFEVRSGSVRLVPLREPRPIEAHVTGLDRRRSAEHACPTGSAA
jgi:hypothetical protein